MDDSSPVIIKSLYFGTESPFKVFKRLMHQLNSDFAYPEVRYLLAVC